MGRVVKSLPKKLESELIVTNNKQYENEIWKDIIIERDNTTYNYTGVYQVSNIGRVKSLNYRNSGKEEILKTRIIQGYERVRLHSNGEAKDFSVHRLVATMFIPNPDSLPIVNHKDECKTNNNVNNLEWCTYQYNSQYSAKPLTKEHKNKISEALKSNDNQMTEEHKRKISEAQSGSKSKNAKKIICLETKQVFECIMYAEDWCKSSSIYKHLKGKTKYAGQHPDTGEQLHWMYYEEFLKKYDKNI